MLIKGNVIITENDDYYLVCKEPVDMFIYYLVDMESFEVVGACFDDEDLGDIIYREDSGEIIESIPYKEFLTRNLL